MQDVKMTEQLAGHEIAGHDKTAELSQRRPRDAPNIWAP